MRILPTFITLIIFLAACTSDIPSTPAQTQENQEEAAQQDTTFESLNAAIVEDPSNPDNFLERARYYFAQQNFNDARKDLTSALRLDSLRDDIYFERGELLFAMKNFDEAMEDYQRCTEINEDATDCQLKLGEMQILLRQYAEALKHINQALKVDDQLPYGYYMKGRIYKETGDTLLAASSYQTAIEVDPDYYDAYIEIALLYAAAKSDLAIEYYNTALEIRPESVEAHYNLAYYLQQSGTKENGRFEEAFDHYERILEIDDQNAAAAFNIGYIHLEYLQNYDSAIVAFTQACDLYPGYFQAFYNRGLSYESLGDSENALKDYNRALAIQPDFTNAAIAKGRVLGE